MKNIAIFLTLLVTASCSPVLKLVFGIKKPGIETPQTIIDYSSKLNKNYYTLIADSTFWKTNKTNIIFDINSSKALTPTAFKFPALVVFDAHGNGAVAKISDACGPGASSILDVILNKATHQHTGSKKLNADFNYISKMFTDVNNNKVNFKEIEDGSQYYIGIMSTKSGGRLNNKFIKEVEYHINHYSNVKIKVIYFACDITQNSKHLFMSKND